MKKNTFVEGTLIASLSLIFIKFLGAVYVIPFYDIVGELGGALYSYAYTVYTLVLNICTAGIPIAISKIISEYCTLEMYDAKERTLKIGNKIVTIISSILFLAVFIFAKELAHFLIGNATGGNTIEEIELVIRSISFCLLIVPLLAIKKGYLQGHKIISPTTNSQVIEQIVRIAIILVGSYLTINVFKLDVSIGVAISTFGAFIAGLVAYIYLEIKIRKNKKELNTHSKIKKDDVTNKSILKKIIKYSIPLIIVSIATDIYNMTDLSLIIRGLTKIGYSGATAETISSVISTWASKICLIVNAIAIGLSISLIPHMVSHYVKKEYKAINQLFNKAIGIVIVVGLPMSIGISLLSSEIYTIFYGYSEYGNIVLKLLPFSILMTNITLIINMSLQALNKFKTIYLSTITGLLINALLDIPLILLFNKLGIYPYYGAIVATIIGSTVSLIISLSKLKKEMDFKYKDLLKIIGKIILPIIFMSLCVLLISYLLKDTFNTRLTMLITCFICVIVSSIVYGIITYKNKLLNNVLGEEYINNILRKLKLKK